jgi:hypothetical protein
MSERDSYLGPALCMLIGGFAAQYIGTCAREMVLENRIPKTAIMEQQDIMGGPKNESFYVVDNDTLITAVDGEPVTMYIK